MASGWWFLSQRPGRIVLPCRLYNTVIDLTGLHSYWIYAFLHVPNLKQSLNFPEIFWIRLGWGRTICLKQSNKGQLSYDSPHFCWGLAQRHSVDCEMGHLYLPNAHLPFSTHNHGTGRSNFSPPIQPQCCFCLSSGSYWLVKIMCGHVKNKIFIKEASWGSLRALKYWGGGR